MAIGEVYIFLSPCQERKRMNNPVSYGQSLTERAMSDYKGDKRFPTEADFQRHFWNQVAPLCDRLRNTTFGAILENDLDNAMFVFRHGKDVIMYYRERWKLNDFARNRLDIYVSREHARVE
jgi:hypothetical protein